MVEEETEIREVEHTEYPWYVREIKRFNLGYKFKLLALLGLAIVGIYFMFQWFSWYYLLGLLPAPAWYFWALRQIDRESYLLIEVRLENDEYAPGKRSGDTQTNIFQIPPDIWKEIKKVGNPYYAGHRVYFCDHFQVDHETGEHTIYFSNNPELSNLNFIAKSELWIRTKKMVPKLQRELAFFRYHNKVMAMEIATAWLEKFGVLEVLEENKVSPRETRKIIHEGVDTDGR